MKWTSLNDLRESFLSFFESKEHLRLPSFSLVPVNDKSLLLINSGMAPMKKFFTGEEEPPRNRVCTCQKCIRTGDIENVGKTARHGTFFEMLGNFSFGDYFKEDAIKWSWEFLTKVLEIPENLLYPSIYENDEEAYKLWNEVVGVPSERIVRLGKADNFWEHGSGPCGPCSEIYFDRGEKYGCGDPNCYPGCECDRFIEIWNNVFSQFSNDGEGNYTELEHKNIDTGMGLERLACIMQGVDNLFEVDSIRKILDTVCSIAQIKYGEDSAKDVSCRVICDHIRSATFMISDGVIPSNEGRGYVLRRLLRRAARHGKLLGINTAFLGKLCDVVVGECGGAYPELCEKHDYIKKVISMEEERFEATIDAGLSILSNMLRESLGEGKTVISGDDVFKLYDTFGFPIDLTREIAEEKGIKIDEDSFSLLMQAQKERARNARADLSSWESSSSDILNGIEKTKFTGYCEDISDAKVLAIIYEGDKVNEVNEGSFKLILDRTPFYGEGGGQVGDIGTITKKGAVVSVIDTKKTDGVYFHICEIASGSIAVGDTVKAEVSKITRESIKRNHSSVHLLQAALRSVLGNHVEQAGSYVDSERLRFDFTHFTAVTEEELAAVEGLVNANIMLALSINTTETDIESARKMGAMALFGEKYGKTVRVVKMGDFSVELCGGTHASNTGNIGLFKIISETSVAAGVRRIEAVSGLGVLALIAEKDKLISDAAAELKSANVLDIAKKAAHLQGELAKMKKEVDAANSKLAAGKLDDIMSGAIDVGDALLVTADLGEMPMDAARDLCDKIRDKNAAAVVVVAIHSQDKLNFIAACGKKAVAAGAHAGNLLRAVSAVCGGKGGGRPDSATSGGKDISKIADALTEAKAVLMQMLQK